MCYVEPRTGYGGIERDAIYDTSKVDLRLTDDVDEVMLASAGYLDVR